MGQGGLCSSKAWVHNVLQPIMTGSRSTYQVGQGVRFEKRRQRTWKGDQSQLTRHQGHMGNEPGERGLDPPAVVFRTSGTAVPTLRKREVKEAAQKEREEGRTRGLWAQEGDRGGHRRQRAFYTEDGAS